jgi:hypothetical protein
LQKVEKIEGFGPVVKKMMLQIVHCQKLCFLVGGWVGGWVDGLVGGLTDVNAVLKIFTAIKNVVA